MKVLVFAPHNDDEVLGVGGTIAKHVQLGDEVCVCEVTSGPKYKMMQEEARKAHAVMGVQNSVFLNLPYVELADISKRETNAKIQSVVTSFQPDIVYIPFRGDMHLDHRMVTEAAMVAVRPLPGSSVKKVYMYETLSETGWNVPNESNTFIPNVWVDITDTIDIKVKAMKCYESQIQTAPHPRSEHGILALAAYRGASVSIPYSESFMLVREIL